MRGQDDFRRMDQTHGPIACATTKRLVPQSSHGKSELRSSGAPSGLAFLIEQGDEFVEVTAGDRALYRPHPLLLCPSDTRIHLMRRVCWKTSSGLPHTDERLTAAMAARRFPNRIANDHDLSGNETIMMVGR
jgi:hypothetical protein